MNKDDLVYISLLLLSIPFGFIFKLPYFKTAPNAKAILSTLLGITTVLIVCENDITYSAVLILTNSFLIKLIHPKYMPYFSFFWCFSYLLFFRMTYLFGLPRPLPYANAVQLVLTLKAVGLSFEIHDSYMRKTKLFKLESNSRTGDDPNAKKEAESINLELKYISITKQPSILEMISYQYCYIGILTGPYFKFKTYQDWLNTKYSQNLNDSLKFVLKRNNYTPFILIGFLFISRYVSFGDPLKASFYDSSIWYRLLYMPLIFTLFRFRFYIAWIFSECSCITSDFGCYPIVSKPKPGAGPTNLIELDNCKNDNNELSFETVHNIDEYYCETEVTVKRVLHYWNMTVQWWMANYVYKRIPFKSAGQPLTMFLSAYWHGIHPGYYLSMLTTSPCIMAEYLMEKGLKFKFISQRFHFIYNFFAWLFRTREFDYMSIGFILLSFDETIKYWRSVYFIGHFTCLFFIIFGFMLKSIPIKKKE